MDLLRRISAAKRALLAVDINDDDAVIDQMGTARLLQAEIDNMIPELPDHRIMLSSGTSTSVWTGASPIKLIGYQNRGWVTPPNADWYAEHSCTHTYGPHRGQSTTFNLEYESIVNEIRLLNRVGSGLEDRAYGLQVYAGGTLCGTWPEGANEWTTIKCPSVKASSIMLYQPKEAAITVCGVEVFGKRALS